MAQVGDKRTISKHMPDAARSLSAGQDAAQACTSTTGKVTRIAGDKVSVKCEKCQYIEIQR